MHTKNTAIETFFSVDKKGSVVAANLGASCLSRQM